MRLGEARVPEGLRVFAIGDVHGLDEQLAAAHGKIAADLARRPAPDHRIVHLGDYVDRGPASAAVVERLARRSVEDPHLVCLRGNHDQMMLDFLADPVAAGPDWFANGGEATLASYGVASSRFRLFTHGYAGIRDELAAALPEHHRHFLDGLLWSVRYGDFFFCHAGIRPGVPLDAQEHSDLIWIRGAFLWDPRDHGVVVVHGHTPVRDPEVEPNRIGIDTGAVYGGRLTVLALDGADYRFL